MLKFGAIFHDHNEMALKLAVNVKACVSPTKSCKSALFA